VNTNIKEHRPIRCGYGRAGGGGERFAIQAIALSGDAQGPLESRFCPDDIDHHRPILIDADENGAVLDLLTLEASA
jgi:hypothetical protein